MKRDIRSELGQTCAGCCRIPFTLPDTTTRYRRFLRPIGYTLLPAAEPGQLDGGAKKSDATVDKEFWRHPEIEQRPEGPSTDDNRGLDQSASCPADPGVSHFSKAGPQADVGVLDVSGSCEADLGRDARSPAGGTGTATCVLDLASRIRRTRRCLARAGLHHARRWLCGLGAVCLWWALSPLAAAAQPYSIHASNAVFHPPPLFLTHSPAVVKSPRGPFLLDWDDGVLEADVNGNGHDASDPEVKDYDGDGTRELPPHTPLNGEFEFTSFYVPEDVQIATTGPLIVRASREVAVFGVMRLKSGVALSTTTNVIELRTSAWLSEDGSPISFATGLTNPIVTDLVTLEPTNSVPPVRFTTLDWDNDDYRTILGLDAGHTNGTGGVLLTNPVVRFRTRSDMHYRVFYRDLLEGSVPGWRELTTNMLRGDGFPQTWTDGGSRSDPAPSAPDLKSRFYRLGVQRTAP